MRHAETFISLQWYVLVLKLRLPVYTLFQKGRSNLGKTFLHPSKYALPYTYGALIKVGLKAFCRSSYCVYSKYLKDVS